MGDANPPFARCGGMDEIKLLYSADKIAFARQLQSALAEAGYPVAIEEIAAAEGAAIAGRARGAAAALLVWSRELAASAALDGWLRSLRALPNLIELSTDGIAPQEGDESRIVLLSGWRGQPFHQGWQRLLAELGALCERRAPAPAAPLATASVPAASAPPQPSRAAEAGAPSGRSSRNPLSRPVVAAVAAILVLAGIGASLLGRHGSPAAEPPAARPAPAAAMSASPPAGVAAAGRAGAAPSPVEAAAPLSAAQAPPAALPAEAAVRTASSASAHRPAPLPVKHYSRRNSRTMRLFCARAGRHTPQCRIFLHSVGGR